MRVDSNLEAYGVVLRTFGPTPDEVEAERARRDAELARVMVLPGEIDSSEIFGDAGSRQTRKVG